MTVNGATRTRILIADDHKVVAEGLASSLSPFYTVTARVYDLESLVGAIQRNRPEVVVLDITFAGVSSLPVMRRALEQNEVSTRFVVLTAHESAALERAAINAGAHACLLKGASTNELRLAIDAAVADRRYVAPVEWPARGRPDRPVLDIEGVKLRPKQVRVLLLLHEGLSRRQLAERLNVGVRAVDFHLTVAKKAIGIRTLQLLLKWVAERRELLAAALAGAAEEE